MIFFFLYVPLWILFSTMNIYYISIKEKKMKTK